MKRLISIGLLVSELALSGCSVFNKGRQGSFQDFEVRKDAVISAGELGFPFGNYENKKESRSEVYDYDGDFMPDLIAEYKEGKINKLRFNRTSRSYGVLLYKFGERIIPLD